MSDSIIATDPNEMIERADDFFEVYYYEDGIESKVICTALVEIPDFDSDGLRGLTFHVTSEHNQSGIKGIEQKIVNRTAEMDDGRELMSYVTTNINYAIGIYLGYLEAHGLSEIEAWGLLDEFFNGSILDEYAEYVDSLSRKERGKIMLDQIQRRIQRLQNEGIPNALWETALRDGEWEKSRISDDLVGMVEDAVGMTDIDPRSCHYSVQGVFRKLHDDDRVEYCEGLAMSKFIGRVQRHAWLRVNDRLVDVTWPWHRYDGDEGIYRGIPIESDVVLDRMDSVGRGCIVFKDSI